MKVGNLEIVGETSFIYLSIYLPTYLSIYIYTILGNPPLSFNEKA